MEQEFCSASFPGPRSWLLVSDKKPRERPGKDVEFCLGDLQYLAIDSASDMDIMKL